MKHDKQKTNWIIDGLLFGGFLVSLWLDLTGVAAHQWLGLALAGLAGYHLWAHWSWVEALTVRLFGRTSKQSRRFYAVDFGLAVGLGTILATGLAISTWLNLSLASYAAWRSVHVLASVLALALLVIKIGLHWRWIASVARRRILPAPTFSRPDVAQPASAAVQLDRRDFLRIMGIAGAAALLAGVNVLSHGGAQTEATSTSQATGLANAPSGSGTSSCIARCQRGCSYPGHCRRYADANGNGRCDLGECEIS